MIIRFAQRHALFDNDWLRLNTDMIADGARYEEIELGPKRAPALFELPPPPLHAKARR